MNTQEKTVIAKAKKMWLDVILLPGGGYLVKDMPPGPISGIGINKKFDNIGDLEEFLDNLYTPRKRKWMKAKKGKKSTVLDRAVRMVRS